MFIYIVKRVYGRSEDYLSAWDKDYGTACRGHKKYAMTFGTKESAEAAATRANKECTGYRGEKRPDDMVFSVEKIKEPHQNYMPDDEAFLAI